MAILKIFIIFIMCYLIGSVPFAYIVVKIIKGVDIRRCGSKNCGATNVARVCSFKAGLVVFFLDFLKGFLPVFLLNYLKFKQIITSNNYELVLCLCALSIILGHIFTIFLNFKGGKGVATSAGVFLALSPLAMLAALIVFLLVVIFTRYISLGSILAAITLPLSYYFIYGKANVYVFSFTVIIAVVVILKHRSNIKRLIKGEENRFFIKKGEQSK